MTWFYETDGTYITGIGSSPVEVIPGSVETDEDTFNAMTAAFASCPGTGWSLKTDLTWVRTAPVESTAKAAETKVVYITREEYDLLKVTDESTIYYITETDNTITLERGKE